jgi:hypothetical protein
VGSVRLRQTSGLDLIRALKELGPEARVKGATLSPFPTCDRRCTLEDALIGWMPVSVC